MAEKCAWMNPPCKVPASVRIVGLNKCFCEDHYLINVMRFGVVFEAQKIGSYAAESQSDVSAEPK